MADTKITALTALTAADPANDVIPIVDVSDTTMAASGTTKKISVNNILGASGTATLASATITGDLTVDTNTLKVDSTNNRVIVGHTSGSSAFQVTNAGAAGLEIQPTGVNSAPVILSYNRSGSAYTQLTLDGSSVVHNLSGSTAMTLDSTGLAVANGNVILSTSGKGIDFSATTSGSGTMTSELLNDYEEGTFTPTVNVGTFSAASGRYTKIGNMVTIFFDVTVGTAGGSQITNLPFTAAATSTVASGIYTNAQTYAALTTAPVVVVGGSGSVMYFRTVGTGVAFAAMTLTAAANLTGSISYFV